MKLTSSEDQIVRQTQGRCSAVCCAISFPYYRGVFKAIAFSVAKTAYYFSNGHRPFNYSTSFALSNEGVLCNDFGSNVVKQINKKRSTAQCSSVVISLCRSTEERKEVYKKHTAQEAPSLNYLTKFFVATLLAVTATHRV